MWSKKSQDRLFVILLNHLRSLHWSPGSMKDCRWRISGTVKVYLELRRNSYTDSSGGTLRTVNSTSTSSGLDFWRVLRVELHAHVLHGDISQYGTQRRLKKRTFSRRPSWGASTVIKRALIPRCSTCCTRRFVISRSLFTYLSSMQMSNARRDAGRVILILLTVAWTGLDPAEQRRRFHQRNMKPK